MNHTNYISRQKILKYKAISHEMCSSLKLGNRINLSDKNKSWYCFLSLYYFRAWLYTQVIYQDSNHVSESSKIKAFRVSNLELKRLQALLYLAFCKPLFWKLWYFEFLVIKIRIIECLYINRFRFLKSFNEWWVYGMADDANNKTDSTESVRVQSRPMTFLNFLEPFAESIQDNLIRNRDQLISFTISFTRNVSRFRCVLSTQSDFHYWDNVRSISFNAINRNYFKYWSENYYIGIPS